jgi:hydroxyethylthiazole kinase
MSYTSGRLLGELRDSAPLIHHITNWVTIAACADLAKSLGASPVMAHARAEVADMAAMAGALVLNIGTLDPAIIGAMIKAARSANAHGVPVILDACGAGATPYRDASCVRLLSKARVDIIKGNASEICRLAGIDVRTKGVDSGETGLALDGVARKLAARRGAVVAITGKSDFVAQPGGPLYRVDNGHELMARVVDTGCMAATAIGCFAALTRSERLPGLGLAEAVALGLACYEVAAEKAAALCSGPGSFIPALMDSCFRLDPEEADAGAKIEALA